MNNKISPVSRFTKILSAAFCVGIAAYLISIIWFNFNGSAFYIFDVYSDALVARYMAQEGTLFPSNWVFGNQYYVAATPALAALVYKVCHDSVTALSVASCIMTFLILASFIWCCKPFCRKESVIVGLFCLIGAVIIGNGICTYKEGLQFLYTLASFYACYVIGFLLTLGAYYRVKCGVHLSRALFISALLLNIALGMQSPREMLVLNIPLIIVEAISILFARIKKSNPPYNKKTVLFVLAMFFANLFGMWFVTVFEKNTVHLISELSLVESFPELILKLKIAFDNLAAINGLLFLRQGIKWIPLGLMGVFIVIVMLIALFRIIVRRDTSAVSQMFLFPLLSVACVFGVGVLIFTCESRYFFIRHVTAAFAFMYLAEMMPENFWKKAGLTALLFCGAANLFYNVYPDYCKVKPVEALYTQVGEDLLQQGIDCVFIDNLSHPGVAACSNDEIACATFYPKFDNFKETGALLESVIFLRPIDLLENIDPSRSAIVISHYHDVYMTSFFDQLRDLAPECYNDMLMSHLTLERVYESDLMDLYVYTFDDASIII